MLKNLIVCLLVLIPALAAAQTDQQDMLRSIDPAVFGPGIYAAPFVPLLSTPIAQLPSPVLQVGASNATGDNVAGAGNSTTSLAPQLATPPLIEPTVKGADVSTDLYPHNNDTEEHH
jgi:hypothetical protein